MTIFNREPVLILGLVQTLIALAVAFGLTLTAGQVGAINAAAAAVLSIVARQLVTPLASPRTAEGKPATLNATQTQPQP